MLKLKPQERWFSTRGVQ